MASLAMGIILAVLAPLIIAANVLVAIALLRLIWKTGYKGHYFVLNLAAADAIVGLSVVGLVRGEFFEHVHPKQIFCVLRMAFVTSSSAASILSLTLVACYRHLAIRKPFHYHQLLTGTRVALHLVALWLLAGIIGFLPLLIPGFRKISLEEKCSFFRVFHLSYILIISCMGFFPVLFLFIYFYCDMLKIASVHVQQIREAERAGLARGSTSDMKAMRTVAMLVGCFVLSWLPFFIAGIVQIVCTKCFYYRVIESYLWLLGLCNSLLNPLLYSYRQKDVRQQLSQLAAGVKRKVLHLGKGCCFPNRGTESIPAVSSLQLQD